MSMLSLSKQFDDATIRLLRSCMGRELHAYEAFSPFGDDHHVYKTLHLFFDDLVIEVKNEHEPIPLGPDYDEEQFAILHADHAGKDKIWTPAGKDLVRTEIGAQINDVLVVTDTVLFRKGSRKLNQIKLAQSIVFEDEDGRLIVFDRDAWPDEYLTVREGKKVSETTRDFRGDFVAEPPYSYEFGRDILRLSNPHV